MQGFEIRSAIEKDVPLILDLIRELAEYEKLSNEVVANRCSGNGRPPKH